MTPDTAQLSFNPESLFVLNLCLGLIMFGVSLHIKWVDFQTLWQEPKAVFLGLLAQLFLLPAGTFLLVLVLQPHPSLALGMLLVAACPGGNISNFISHLAKGNVALSVSLTGVVTLLCVVSTPFNFTFWSSLLPISAKLEAKIHLNFWEMAQTIWWLIILPVLTGGLLSHYQPWFTSKISKPIQQLSLVIFVAFVLLAFYNNFGVFMNYFHYIFGLVLLHNALALGLGFGLAKLGGLKDKEVKTICIETGIQNSGLGLILIFNFFDGLGGMALIAAWWGVWHILSGLSLAWMWSRSVTVVNWEERVEN